MSQPYIVKGCEGPIKPRLPLHHLEANPMQFSLFIRAFLKIMEPSYRSHPASFVQIGGIHGLPYQKWPGDPVETPVPGPDKKQWLGYCHHSEIFFPTWHRVVLLLLEQSLSEAAKEIAGQDIQGIQDASEQGAWRQAAEDLRFPFWDWTEEIVGQQGLPEIFRQPTISITVPGVTRVEVKNPLQCYNFGPVLPDGFIDVGNQYWHSWYRTYRWPKGVRLDPPEDYTKLDGSFTGSYRGEGLPVEPVTYLRQKVAQLFTLQPMYTSKTISPALWDHFSNNEPQSGDLPPQVLLSSIEDPHNKVHLDIGGYGHMGDNDYAGFDPIFYLHHCNVDRLYAFWEAVYPDFWMGMGYYNNKNGMLTPFKNPDGTFTEPEGIAVNQTTDLTPFRKSSTAYWSSNDVRFLYEGTGVVTKHYTYPPIGSVSIDQAIPVGQRAQCIAVLQAHFGFTPTLDLGKLKSGLKPRLFNPPSLPDHIPSDHVPVVKYRHFVFIGELIEHAFNGSYSLELVLASAPQVSVGSIAVLTRRDPTRCANCIGRQARGTKSRGIIVIPINIIHSLLEKGGHNHDGASDDDVLDFLKKSFTAKIVDAGGALLAETPHPAIDNGGVDLATTSVPTLTFFSAAASRPADSEDGPHYLYDWKEHGAILGEGQWKDRRESA